MKFYIGFILFLSIVLFFSNASKTFSQTATPAQYTCGLFMDRNTVTDTTADAYIIEHGNGIYGTYDRTEWRADTNDPGAQDIVQTNNSLDHKYTGLRPSTNYNANAIRKSSSGAPDVACNIAFGFRTLAAGARPTPSVSPSISPSISPNASVSGSLTPSPNASGSSTPNADTRRRIFDVGYPSFNDIAKQALIIIPIFIALFWLL